MVSHLTQLAEQVSRVKAVNTQTLADMSGWLEQSRVLRKSEIIEMTILLVCLSNIRCSTIVQVFTKEPEDISVIEGSNVTLPCTVTNKAGELQWTKDDFGLGTSRELDGYERYRMVGDDDNTYNLEIVNATVEDEALYQCQVGATEDARPIRSRYARLTIISKSLLTIQQDLPLAEGELVSAQCVATGGDQEPDIKWLRNNVYVESGIKESMTKLNKKKIVKTSSFQFHATKNDTSVTCEVTHNAVAKKEEISKRITVNHAPFVSITSDSDYIQNGDKVLIICNVDSLPMVDQIIWTINDEIVEDAGYVRELVITADRGMNGDIITCMARNELGIGSAQYILDIKCKNDMYVKTYYND